MRFLLLALVFSLVPAKMAFAQCSAPYGVEGEIVYNSAYNVPQYCDGSNNWIAMVGAPDLSGQTGLTLLSSIAPDAANLNKAEFVLVKGDHAFVAAYDNDHIAAIDISDPDNPVVESTKITGLGDVQAFSIAGDVLYAIYDDSTDQILATVDISDPANMTLLDTAAAPTSYNIGQTVVHGNYAYGANSHTTYIWNVNDPANISYVGEDAGGVDGTYNITHNGIYYTIDDSQLCSYELGDPEDPGTVNCFSDTDTSITTPRDMAAQGNYLFYNDRAENKMVVVDVSDPYDDLQFVTELTAPEIVAPEGIFVAGDYAYIASTGNDSVVLVNIENPSNPFVVGSVSDATALAEADSVYARNGKVYVANAASGFAILDIEYGPAHSTLTGIVPDGLIGHWRLDETSETTAFDSSGNGYDGTAMDGLNFTDDSTKAVVGRGVTFDPTENHHIEMSVSPPVANEPEATFCAWANPIDASGPYAIVSQYRSGSLTPGWLLQIDGGNNTIEFHNQGIWQGAPDVVLPKKWAHYCATFVGGSFVRLYVNAVLVGEHTSAIPAVVEESSSGYFRIGQITRDNDFNGSIDDVRIYNRALESEEIEEVYEARDGIRYDGVAREYKFFDGNKHVSMTSPWPEPDPDPQGPGYIPNAVRFDGTYDYVEADGYALNPSTQLTFSFWVKQGSAMTSYRLINDNGDRTQIWLSDDDTVGIFVRDDSDSQILGCQTDITSLDDTDQFHHFLFSMDSETSDLHIFIDDVDVTPGWCSFNSSNAYQPGVDFRIGGDNYGNLHDVDMAEVWYDLGTYIDFSVEANRRDFIDASGTPVFLGADGSMPTGSAPDIFLSGPVATWHENKGAGEGFSEIGQLTSAPPPGADSNGLVAHWKLDEITYTSAIDSSGNGNAGDFQNNTDPAQDSRIGAVGGAIDFTGDGARVFVAHDDVLTPTNNDVTVSFWVNTSVDWDDEADTLWRLMDKKDGPSDTSPGWYIIIGGYIDEALGVYLGDGATDVFFGSGDLEWDVNRWYHVAFVYDGSEEAGSWYRDGAYLQTDVRAGFAPDWGSADLLIGTGQYNDELEGAMDDIRIYDRTLSANEIRKLYNMGAPVGSSTSLPERCPNPGDICDDGTVYVGLSPVDSLQMYSLQNHVGSLPYNNGNNTGYTDVIGLTTSGEDNTNILVVTDSDDGVGGFQPHQAALACYELNASGTNDWFVPGYDELSQTLTILISNNLIVLPESGSWRYWSSEEGGPSPTGGSIRYVQTDGSISAGWYPKHGVNRALCVRKGPAPRCANPYGLEGQIVYNEDYDVVQYCDGARWRAIGKYSP